MHNVLFCEAKAGSLLSWEAQGGGNCAHPSQMFQMCSEDSSWAMLLNWQELKLTVANGLAGLAHHLEEIMTRQIEVPRGSAILSLRSRSIGLLEGSS